MGPMPIKGGLRPSTAQPPQRVAGVPKRTVQIAPHFSPLSSSKRRRSQGKIWPRAPGADVPLPHEILLKRDPLSLGPNPDGDGEQQENGKVRKGCSSGQWTPATDQMAISAVGLGISRYLRFNLSPSWPQAMSRSRSSEMSPGSTQTRHTGKHRILDAGSPTRYSKRSPALPG
jgi:hypothetical protein